MGIRNAWVTLQKKSIWHWGTLIALAALGYLTFLRAGYGGSSLSLALMWGIFLLVETAPMLWTMLIFTGAMLMVSRIFPPAGFVFLLIGIIFFVLRIRYVIQNLALLCSGLVVYALYYAWFGNDMGLLRKAADLIYSVLTLGHSSFIPLFVRFQFARAAGFIASALPAVPVHFLLCAAYRRGYECRSALTVMFGLPLVVLSFLLPFLKLFGALDGASFADAGHGGHMGPDGFHTAGDGYVPADGHGVPVQHVNGYFRTTPGGGTTYVHPHVATNPDGIIENNLSYHGAHFQGAPLPGDTAPPPAAAGVHPPAMPYVDTAPGIVIEEGKTEGKQSGRKQHKSPKHPAGK